jgi:hypothetical protein
MMNATQRIDRCVLDLRNHLLIKTSLSANFAAFAKRLVEEA